MTIGYGGTRPEFRAKRGSEVRDDKTGAITREGEPSPQNIAVDRLEWLGAHKRILPHQKAAGERLQQDWQLAQRLAFAAVGGALGGSGTNRLPDIKCDASTRFGDARARLGGDQSEGWRIVDLIVLQNISLEKAEQFLRLPLRSGLGSLRTALDVLAGFYRLA
jgi:hypothetical protein